jgi:hypothetical protein
VKETWLGVNLPHEAVARTNRLTGWAVIEDAAVISIERGCFAVDLTGLKSIDPPALPGQDVRGRDEGVAVMLHYDKHPIARLRLGKATVVTSAVTVRSLQIPIQGDLEIAGVVKPVVFDTRLQLQGDAVSIAGQTTITRDQFQIEFPSANLPVEVDEQITIEFSVVVRR